MSEDCWSLNYCPLEEHVNRFLAEKQVSDEGRHDTSLALSLSLWSYLCLDSVAFRPKMLLIIAA